MTQCSQLELLFQDLGSREVLARFLSHGTVGLRNTQAVREALLSIGRTPRGHAPSLP